VAEPILIIGGGGHGRVVIDALRAAGDFEPIAIVDSRVEGERDGVPVRGGDDALPGLLAEGIGAAAIGVGSVGDATARRRVHERALQVGFALPAIVHPHATVSPTARLCPGCFIAAGAVVGPGAVIGEGAIINSNAVVDHDCTIGAFAHVAPGAALSGGVVVGEGTLVGTGAAVIQGVRIGAHTRIGAGASVVTDIIDGATVVGVPARPER
jgi:sugar O-acyltransferase (sialic acid O-acetyltransferase NeuD family)